MSKKLLMNTNLTEQDSYRRYYQEYGGTFITVSDKSEDDTIDTDRFIEVTEIWGNTVQDENNLEDIQSVGELYVDEEGQPILDDLGREQYKIEISSCNSNLLKKELFNKSVLNSVINYSFYVDVDKVFPSKSSNYKFTRNKGSNVQCLMYEYDAEGRQLSANYWYNLITYSFTLNEKTKYFKIIVRPTSNNAVYNEDVDNYFNEEYDIRITINKDLPYTPHQSHKTTILLPCQLQKVGDVYDRLYWDSEKGKYVVEKNIEKDLLGDMSWVYQGSGVAYCARFKLAEKYMYSGNTTTYNIVSGFKNKPVVWSDLTTEEGFYNYASVKYLSIIKEPAISTLDEFILEVKNKKYYLLSVLKASQLIETNITEKILLPCYSEKTHVFVNSTVDASMKVLMPYKEII